MRFSPRQDTPHSRQICMSCDSSVTEGWLPQPGVFLSQRTLPRGRTVPSHRTHTHTTKPLWLRALPFVVESEAADSFTEQAETVLRGACWTACEFLTSTKHDTFSVFQARNHLTLKAVYRGTPSFSSVCLPLSSSTPHTFLLLLPCVSAPRVQLEGVQKDTV